MLPRTPTLSPALLHHHPLHVLLLLLVVGCCQAGLVAAPGGLLVGMHQGLGGWAAGV
jgi:hypothetical protein